MGGTLYVCAVCGKKVRGHQRVTGRVELTRPHRITNTARANELGIAHGAVCPGMHQGQHRPAHKPPERPGAGPCLYCGAPLVETPREEGYSVRSYSHLSTAQAVACHNAAPNGAKARPA